MRNGFVSILLLIGACAPAMPQAAAPRADSRFSFLRRIAPFPVVDADGRELDLAFLGGFNTPRPQLVDVEADGDLDLVVQELTGQMMLFERDGDRGGEPSFVWREEAFAGIDVGEWHRLVDVDGDGDLDLLAEQPFSYIRYVRNDGTPSAARFVPAADTLRDDDGRPIFADRQNIPFVGDLDCDGLADMLVGHVTGTVARYEAVARDARGVPAFRLVDSRFEDIEIIGQMGSMHGANTMALADPDQDGDPDLIWGDFFEPGLLLIQNTGSCAAPYMRNEPVRFPSDAPVATSGYNAPALGDTDGDGRLDLVVGVLGGAFNPNRTAADNLLHYTRTATSGYELRTRRLLPMLDVGAESIPTLVDLDRDGDLDLLLANKIEPSEDASARVHWFENVGSASAPSLRERGPLDLPAAFHQAPAFGDLDADGDLDLVLGSWGARVAWHRNEGRADSAAFTLVDSALVTLTRGSNTTPTLGDLDGDGDLDLLVGEGSGTINFFRNEGGPREPRFAFVDDAYGEIDVGRRSAPVLADLDGDGTLELLVGSESEGLLLFRDAGAGGTSRFIRDEAFALDVPGMSAPAVGDMNGDGDVDLVIGGVGGGAYYLENVR